MMISTRALLRSSAQQRRGLARKASVVTDDDITKLRSVTHSSPEGPWNGHPVDGLRSIDLFQRADRGTKAASDLRHKGLIPGSLYGGPLGPTSFDVVVEERDLNAEREVRRGSFLNTLYRINFESHFLLAFPRQMSMHPLKEKVLGINWLAYDPERGAKLDLPVLAIGTEDSPGLKSGAYTNMVYWSVPCMIKDTVHIPNSVHLNFSKMELNEKIMWSDVTNVDRKFVEPIFYSYDEDGRKFRSENATLAVVKPPRKVSRKRGPHGEILELEESKSDEVVVKGGYVLPTDITTRDVEAVM